MKRLYIIAMAEISRLPRPVADEWEWQYQGSCRELPSEMFFHPDGERGPRRRNRENTAKAVCASCPVIAACRAHALAVQEPYGIWGGLSEDDRLAILGKETTPDISHASEVSSSLEKKKSPAEKSAGLFLFNLSFSVSVHLDHVSVHAQQHQQLPALLASRKQQPLW
jgi:WhiB family transcriptional regulator, redox-sensing transcriptional regulator